MLTSVGNSNKTEASMTLGVVRQILLVILFFGLVGTGVELLLLEHTEDVRQWIPLALILLSLLVLGWHLVGRAPQSLRALQGIMLAFLAAGLAGIYFHYQGSVEFRLESNPSLAGRALFWAAIHSKAPPALAPGAMIQLGLIGLAYGYRHPVLRRSRKNQDDTNGGE